MASTHAADAARLHIAGQPSTFLTSLGPEVLSVFYRALPQSPTAFGFAMVDNRTGDGRWTMTDEHRTTDDEHRLNGRPLAAQPVIVGFVAASSSTGALFLDLGTRHLLQFLPPLLARYGQRPGLLWQSVQTLFYPLLPKHQAVASQGTPAAIAELLSIMVEPNYRGQGIGAQLLGRLVTMCQASQLAALEVTVDATNTGARRFYAHQGFVEQHTFQLYGRTMCRYRLQMPVLRRNQ